MKYLLLYDHPIFGKVYYGDTGILTSDGRKVLKIKYSNTKYQCFYQSSGLVSKEKGTWFPFDGDVVDSNTGERLLLKLDTTYFASRFKTFVKKKSEVDIVFQKNMIKFGTLLFLYTSYQLGNGIWNTQKNVNIIKKKIQEPIFQENIQSYFDEKNVSFGRTHNSQREVNLFIGNALSFNYLKDIEYFDRDDWILDYREIYRPKLYTFYPNTRVEFKRTLLTKCNDEDDIILDFMIQYNHNQTSLMNFFMPSINGKSIFEDKFCRKRI